MPRHQHRTDRQTSRNGVLRLGHHSYSFADLQSSPCGQAVHRQVEVDDQLVAGQLPAIALTRDGCQYSTVHDSDLAERVSIAIGRGGPSRLPGVPTKPMNRVERAFGKNSSLVGSRSADDHLDAAVLRRRAARRGGDSLDLGAWTMVRNMLGVSVGDAGFDRAHSPAPLVSM